MMIRGKELAMNRSARIFERLLQTQIIALLSPESETQCVRAYELCHALDVTLEVAFRTEVAERGIRAVCEKHPDALVLAGTVLTIQQAERAIQAGAAGIVSSDYIPSVVEFCARKDVMCVPGGLSDVGKQLAQKAEVYKCSLEELRDKYPYQWVYKLFPAFSGSQNYLDIRRSWRGPYKNLTVIYTGGVNIRTLKEGFRKDPEGVFCGSDLTNHVNEPEKMAADIQEWKEVMKPPGPSFAKKAKKGPKEELDQPRVVTFGELMLRLSPPTGIRLNRARTLDVHFGGAEANVAVSLSNFGISSRFVSALPNNDIGTNALAILKMYGVNTQFIQLLENRMGIYYLERGSGSRPSKVIYDRGLSAFSRLKPGDIDWEQVFEDADWFHWTGITPSLSESLAELLQQGLETAHKMGVKVSADLNYRKKLWSEEEAKTCLTALMPYVDVLFGNEEDPIRIFGLTPRNSDVEKGRINVEGYKELAKSLVTQFGFEKVAITLRESVSATENYWSAVLFDGRKLYRGPRHHVWIVDRVGTGDAFAGGLIYSFLKGKTEADALSFGIAAACLKHSVLGDFSVASVEEVEAFARGQTTGRVQR
jgi:2-dehydro-3-deoxygluconokinase